MGRNQLPVDVHGSKMARAVVGDGRVIPGVVEERIDVVIQTYGTTATRCPIFKDLVIVIIRKAPDLQGIFIIRLAYEHLVGQKIVGLEPDADREGIIVTPRKVGIRVDVVIAIKTVGRVGIAEAVGGEGSSIYRSISIVSACVISVSAKIIPERQTGEGIRVQG